MIGLYLNNESERKKTIISNLKYHAEIWLVELRQLIKISIRKVDRD